MVEPEILATFYVIYFDARDYPGQFVIRRQFAIRDDPNPRAEARLWFEGLVGGSLEAARASLPPDVTLLGTRPAEDPKIVEVWLA